MGLKATRHNGRSGMHGTYNPKHNDRAFDLKHLTHIDDEKAKGNLYWDYYQGYFHQAMGVERKYNFSEIEKIYYYENYNDYVEAQNERNIANRHKDRNRTIDDVLKNNKTCPEETILQLGNIDGTVESELLAVIAAEYFKEFERKFGAHVHILDWALHLDEATPHIHERHVFDALNKYGELCPQQDRALENLGFELPNPEKPKGKYNNRKISFDAECRNIFINICERHGVSIDIIPEYGGASYLEKADYIVHKLKADNERLILENERLQLKHDELVIKIDDVDALLNEVAETAYDKACEELTKEISDKVRTEDIAEIEKAKTVLSSNEIKVPKEIRAFALKQLAKVQSKIESMANRVINAVKSMLMSPEKKEAIKTNITKKVKPSIMDKLLEKRKQVSISSANRNKAKTKTSERDEM